MKRTIKKVAVIGSGIMGSGIACHFANIGVEVLLLDIAPRELTEAEAKKGLTLESKIVRNRLVNEHLANSLKSKPSPIYNQKFKLNGLPKIHEHDGKRPQAFGIIIDGRLVCLYTYETDLSDGWEDAQVHNDTPEKRKQALQMGANIITYVFLN